MSGHVKKVCVRVALTSCRVQRKGQFRTRKDVERDTHFLSSAEGDKSHRKKAGERGALTSFRARREGQVRRRTKGE